MSVWHQEINVEQSGFWTSHSSQALFALINAEQKVDVYSDQGRLAQNLSLSAESASSVSLLSWHPIKRILAVVLTDGSYQRVLQLIYRHRRCLGGRVRHFRDDKSSVVSHFRYRYLCKLEQFRDSIRCNLYCNATLIRLN